MIKNDICPYCRTTMIKAENQPNGKSVEHLIPNAALTRKRSKGEGDFYACRKCNIRKSNIDNILGVVTKSQADNDKMAANTLIEAVTKGHGASKRFIRMANTAELQPGGEVHMKIPIKGAELLEYIVFLGKGQYYKTNHKPFDQDKFVMQLLFANKQVMSSFKEAYAQQHGSDPIRDLEENGYSEIINGGECIIYTKENNYMFVFHDYTVIIVRILQKTRKNKRLSHESKRQIVKVFSKYT